MLFKQAIIRQKRSRIRQESNLMQISYKPLWHTLLEKGMSKEDLRIKAKLTTNAIANMGKDQNISMATLLKICEALQCGFDSVVEIVGLPPKSAPDDQITISKKEVETMHRLNPPRLVSLFSGCGGMDKGGETAG